MRSLTEGENRRSDLSEDFRTEKQFLIGGSGRSGTTLLRRILSQHSQVYALPMEARFITDPDGLVSLALSLSCSWSPFVADLALSRFERLMTRSLYKPAWRRALFPLDIRRLSRHVKLRSLRSLLLPTERYFGVDFGNLEWPDDYYLRKTHEFIDQLRYGTSWGRWTGAEAGTKEIQLVRYMKRKEIFQLVGEYIDRLLACQTLMGGKSYWVEDTPANALYADVLLEMLPNSKLLYIYRDPRDVTASYTRQQWAPKQPKQAAVWLADILERWRDVRGILASNRFIEIRFEDLIDNPRGELGRVCEFLGISFESEMIDLDLSRHNIGRWRRDLGNQDAEIVQSILQEFLEIGRY